MNFEYENIMCNIPEVVLTLAVLVPDEEKKMKLNFYFYTSLWCLKRFHKPFSATTKKYKNKKFNLIQLSEMHGTLRVKQMWVSGLKFLKTLKIYDFFESDAQFLNYLKFSLLMKSVTSRSGIPGVVKSHLLLHHKIFISWVPQIFGYNPTGNYLFKVSNRNTSTMCEIKTPEKNASCRSGVHC